MDISSNILIPLCWFKLLILSFAPANSGFSGFQFFFVLKFLGKVFLVFAGSAIVGKLLKLEKAYNAPELNKKSDKSSKSNTDIKKYNMSKMLFSVMAIPLTEQGTAHELRSYLIGGIIALLIMCYLVYTLIRPEKF